KVPQNISEEQILLESREASMGLSRSGPVDVIVYVDSKAYYNLPYTEKARIAEIIGKVNWAYRDKNRHMLLMVPGRLGTSSPELGVPTTFADISAFDVVCEVEEKEAGYNPELSYGSHIFQDLVESDILYTAVFANKKTLHFAPQKLSAYKNIISDFTHTYGDIVQVYDLKDTACTLYYDLEENHLMLKL
ncbi:MAG: phosphoenolpyruvate synthase, partial [Lachnospiraceae bacterium]|nr:phosphoenolpyruvate synthase [Lachnospiraceae bacterium]